MNTTQREIESYIAASKFEETHIGKEVGPDGKLKDRYHVSVLEQYKKPIYKIKDHTVDIDKLAPGQLYQVKYNFARNKVFTIITEYQYATENHRTLVFTNPDRPEKTVGIPIMNIISCDKLLSK